MLNFKGMRFPIDVILVCIRWGIVKLLSRRDEFRNPERNGRGSDNKCPRLCVLRYIGDLIPERKRLSTHVPVLLRRQAVALASEDVVDRPMRG